MALLDLLGRRMALRVLWELSCADAPLTFRALQTAAETNPNVLNTRLKELRSAGLIDHEAGGYRLSEIGASLTPLILQLHSWADAWEARREAAGRER